MTDINTHHKLTAKEEAVVEKTLDRFKRDHQLGQTCSETEFKRYRLLMSDDSLRLLLVEFACDIKVVQSQDGNAVNEQLQSRIEELKGALAGFTENASTLGSSHPHLSEYYTFPEWVWRRAQAALKED